MTQGNWWKYSLSLHLIIGLFLCKSKNHVFLEIFETAPWWDIKLLMLLDICFDSCSVLSLIIFIMVCSYFFQSFPYCLCCLERWYTQRTWKIHVIYIFLLSFLCLRKYTSIHSHINSFIQNSIYLTDSRHAICKTLD